MLKNLKFPISILKYKFNKFKGEKKLSIKLNDYETNFAKELKKKGYCIIENFYTDQECLELIKIIDEKLLDTSKNILEDETKSDQRIFFSEKLSKKINQYFENNLIKKIGQFYSKYHIVPGFTLANKVTYKPKNLGSGGGWHKDAYYPQFKSILYLNDVNFENGPFQLLDQSNKLMKSIKISIKLKKGYPNTRFSEEELKNLSNEKKITLIGKAGTLILFDGSLIHRGSPILNGKRYALTNYYFPKVDFDNLIQKFKVKIRNE
tara:strand:+ start:401 stop:1189 length:789 start_codon:yes stop_codon:yes gene_type:complete